MLRPCKEEQRQAVLGLLAKGCRGGSSYGFWNSETRTKRKERGIVVASPLQSTINRGTQRGYSSKPLNIALLNVF